MKQWDRSTTNGLRHAGINAIPYLRNIISLINRLLAPSFGLDERKAASQFLLQPIVKDAAKLKCFIILPGNTRVCSHTGYCPLIEMRAMQTKAYHLRY